MKNLNTTLKIGLVGLLALMVVFGCKKSEVPYSAEQETAQIKQWVQTQVKNKIVVDSTSTGMYYVVNKPGTGAVVTDGDSVTVKYTGMFLNGGVFDSSTSFTFVHKAAGQRMIPGWEEGMELMSTGESAYFLIPSAKAYGTSGYATIPPYTPLLFLIEVISIK